MLRLFTNNWRMNNVLLLLPLWRTGPCVYCKASSCSVLLVSLFVVLEDVITALVDVPVLSLILAFIVSFYRRRSVYVTHCICFISFFYHREKPQGECTFWPFFFPLLSLFPFLLSCTTPSSQSWGTTMLVINFLIPFISLSPPPLLSLLSAISLGSRSLLLAHHLCLAVSSVFSLSCKEHVKFSTSIILPYPNTSF